ncbi:hypothetical protein J4573_37480 [Actinomadura barringtoniae]|uniref:non-specific serine/threonine protein kinase n=1 Tax=Actinomadura barringtoniae TaxID=1427535 RepID=A0A939PMW8_9ACTN|nr:hypothetical protein [Actinomadura barringtoniae]MBO2452834.1 hypothetical protein [Actinomadura barringtoniae]
MAEETRTLTLADLLAERGPFPPDRAAVLGLRILDELDTAHRSGVVHRDLRPANVVLEGERVHLTGFADEGVRGTPPFAAPEQARGETATPAGDLWALGATLHAAVEGRPPFAGPMTNAGPLTPVIQALLNNDPARRPTADALRPMLSQASSPPSPQPLPQMPPAPSRRRNPVVLIAVAVATVAVLGAAAVLGYVVFGRDDAYAKNKRDAAAIGGPAGFLLKSDKKVDGDRARRVYSGCQMFCDSSLLAQRVSGVYYVRRWLQTVPQVAAVQAPLLAKDGMSCDILVQTRPGITISNVRVVIARPPARDFTVQFDVG